MSLTADILKILIGIEPDAAPALLALGVTDVDAEIDGQSLSRDQVETATITAVFASGSQNVGTTRNARNCTIARTNSGRFTVTFGSAHPDGADYEVLFGQTEDGANRDVPKVSVVANSRTASGFNVQVTVDDNGTSADGYQDDLFSFAVLHDISVVTGFSAT